MQKLVYFDRTTNVKSAFEIERGKQIKGWPRKRKNELVETKNPQRKYLSDKWGEKDSSLRSE